MPHRRYFQNYTFHRSTDYRIVYQIHARKKEIVIHYINSRQNFYRELTQLNLK